MTRGIVFVGLAVLLIAGCGYQSNKPENGDGVESQMINQDETSGAASEQRNR